MFSCLSSKSILILVTTTWPRQKWRINSCLQLQQRRPRLQGDTSQHLRTSLKEKLQLWPANWQVNGFVCSFDTIPTPNSHLPAFYFSFSPSLYVISTNKLCTKPNTWDKLALRSLNCQLVVSNKEVTLKVFLKKDWIVIACCTWYPPWKYECISMLSYVGIPVSLLKIYASIKSPTAGEEEEWVQRISFHHHKEIFSMILCIDVCVM